jgi:4-hydroxybenzoate polyprenyltransferase
MKNGVAAAWRIVADTATYRVRKREGGNLATSMTLAIALSLPGPDLGWRLAFGVVLNLFVYLLNDCLDVGLDLNAVGRDHARTSFLAQHPQAGWAAVVALGLGATALGALHGAGLLVCFVVTTAVIAAYSLWLKKRPVLDLVSMGAWGITMAMVGFPVGSRSGWWLSGLLGLLCMVTEVVKVIRDEASDRTAEIRTTAVAFGPAACAWLGRLLIVVAAAYSAAFLHRWFGLALLLGVLVPLSAPHVSRSWDLLRIVFGLTWLAILFSFHRAGTLQGWLTVV